MWQISALLSFLCEDHFAVELLELQKGGNGSGSTSTALYHTFLTMLLPTSHDACNPSTCACHKKKVGVLPDIWLHV